MGTGLSTPHYSEGLTNKYRGCPMDMDTGAVITAYTETIDDKEYYISVFRSTNLYDIYKQLEPKNVYQYILPKSVVHAYFIDCETNEYVLVQRSTNQALMGFQGPPQQPQRNIGTAR